MSGVELAVAVELAVNLRRRLAGVNRLRVLARDAVEGVRRGVGTRGNSGSSLLRLEKGETLRIEPITERRRDTVRVLNYEDRCRRKEEEVLLVQAQHRQMV